MALEVHAVRSKSKTRMRVWDTRLRGYRTGELAPAQMLRTLAQLALVGGLHPTTERSHALLRMLERAESSTLTEWHAGRGFQPNIHNALRHSRLAFELAHQLLDDLFDDELDGFLAALGADARLFLTRTFVLHELTRGSGKAVLTTRDGQEPERAGYRDTAHALSLVAELRAHCPCLDIETKDTGQNGSCLITFTLL